ncbi:hypothetical protein [Mucilaginibacter calamicampi]
MQSGLIRVVAFYKSYKATIIAYSFYLAIWWITVSTQSQYHTEIDHMDAGEKVARGEGVMYGYLLIFLLSIGGTIVMLLNALIDRKKRFFYLIMSALIALPLIMYLSIN